MDVGPSDGVRCNVVVAGAAGAVAGAALVVVDPAVMRYERSNRLQSPRSRHELFAISILAPLAAAAPPDPWWHAKRGTNVTGVRTERLRPRWCAIPWRRWLTKNLLGAALKWIHSVMTSDDAEINDQPMPFGAEFDEDLVVVARYTAKQRQI